MTNQPIATALVGMIKQCGILFVALPPDGPSPGQCFELGVAKSLKKEVFPAAPIDASEELDNCWMLENRHPRKIGRDLTESSVLRVGLIRELHDALVPPDARPALDRIEELVKRALDEVRPPRLEPDWEEQLAREFPFLRPEREDSVHRATKELIKAGRRRLTRRKPKYRRDQFLHHLGRFSDLDFRQQLSECINEALRAGAENTLIVQRFCLAGVQVLP